MSIYVDDTAQFNTKCIIFGIGLMVFYWYVPRDKNPLLLPVIFTIGYVLMGWYDSLYDCKARLYSGSRSWGAAILDSTFKPQYREHSERELSESKVVDLPPNKRLVSDQEVVYRRFMYLFHLLVVTPLFVYIGWTGKQTHKFFFQTLFGFSLLGLGYHTMRIFNPRKEQRRSIYLFHTISVLPLALYVTWMQKQNSKTAFMSLLIMGSVAGMYHGFRYLTPMEEKKETFFLLRPPKNETKIRQK